MVTIVSDVREMSNKTDQEFCIKLVERVEILLYIITNSRKNLSEKAWTEVTKEVNETGFLFQSTSAKKNGII